MVLVLLQMVSMAFAEEPTEMALTVTHAGAGAAATFSVTDVPATKVWLLAGMESVSFAPTRGCVGVTMGVMPTRRLQISVDDTGSAAISGTLPESLAGKTAYVQALAYNATTASCEVTEVVEMTL